MPGNKKYPAVSDLFSETAGYFLILIYDAYDSSPIWITALTISALLFTL